MELDPALQGAITWYSCGAFKKLEGITLEQKQELINLLLSFTGEVAVYRDKKGEFPKRQMPIFGQVSIIQAIAISGAILVKDQIEAGFKEHVKSLSQILSWCVDGWDMYKLFGKGA